MPMPRLEPHDRAIQMFRASAEYDLEKRMAGGGAAHYEDPVDPKARCLTSEHSAGIHAMQMAMGDTVDGRGFVPQASKREELAPA